MHIHQIKLRRNRFSLLNSLPLLLLAWVCSSSVLGWTTEPESSSANLVQSTGIKAQNQSGTIAEIANGDAGNTTLLSAQQSVAFSNDPVEGELVSVTKAQFAEDASSELVIVDPNSIDTIPVGVTNPLHVEQSAQPLLPIATEVDGNFVHDDAIGIESAHALPPVDSVPATGGHCCNSCGRDIWMVCSRHLGIMNSRCFSDQKLRVFQLGCDNQWKCRNLSTFLATQSDAHPTCVYVHGNRMKPHHAVERGMKLHGILRQCHEKFRFVIWSWPSQPVPCYGRDARVKTTRSDTEALYVASFLSRLSPTNRVSMLGYSLGARVISGSLHMLAGGSFNGNCIATHGNHVKPRVVLFASAMPRSFLMPNGCHSFTLHQASKVVSIHNSRDPVLRRYWWISKKGPNALGYQGVNRSQLVAGNVLHQIDAKNIVGHSHFFKRYAASPYLMNLARSYMLWHPVN